MKLHSTSTFSGLVLMVSAARAPAPRWSRIAAVSGLLLWLALPANSHGQQLDLPPWPGSPPEYIEVFADWDFTGMTADEQDAFWGIMSPLSDEEVEQKMTPDQVQARHLAIFAISQPEEYARLYPSQQTPEQQADAQFHLWLITHPEEAPQFLKQQRTPEQLQEDAISHWMMLHPNEARTLMQSSLTVDQIKAQALAILEASAPQLKPKPIMKTVPFSDAAASLTDGLPQH